MELSIWKQCLERLQGELSAQQFDTWIRPLQVVEDGANLRLLAPNRFVLDWIKDKYMDSINGIVSELSDGRRYQIDVAVGTSVPVELPNTKFVASNKTVRPIKPKESNWYSPGLNSQYTFSTFVEGKSNQLARAASMQVSENPGTAYNPLFICGGVGLGKTHLMHAVGNAIAAGRPNAKVIYLRSEQFVGDMVKALQHNVISDFKRFYRSVDALLIDDIQFFAGKERSQEEFFHTFNALLEGQQQIVLTCDRYPKEVAGVEERLKSRFGWARSSRDWRHW